MLHRAGTEFHKSLADQLRNKKNAAVALDRLRGGNL
jgi:hypothetical protein